MQQPDLVEATDPSPVAMQEQIEPAETSTEPQEPDDPTEQAVLFDYGPDRAQNGWLRTPRLVEAGTLAPVVVLIHGGFWSEPWDHTLMTPLEQSLLDAGFATWNIEFRRVGGRGGWPETFEDVSAAIDRLYGLAGTYPLDLESVTLIGHSSGGHLALRSLDRPSARVQATGAIGLAAVTDLQRTTAAVSFLGGSIEQIPETYLEAAPIFDVDRTVLIHGDADTIVPVANLETARAAGVPVVLVANEDHFDAIAPGSQIWLRTLETLELMIVETAP